MNNYDEPYELSWSEYDPCLEERLESPGQKMERVRGMLGGSEPGLDSARLMSQEEVEEWLAEYERCKK